MFCILRAEGYRILILDFLISLCYNETENTKGGLLMKSVNVYEQYFKGSCDGNGVQRNGAQVRLTAESDAGQIRYTLSVNFFPHNDPEDFSISYDVYLEETVYAAKGRRSKKREAELLDSARAAADKLAGTLGGIIRWDEPLIEARFG